MERPQSGLRIKVVSGRIRNEVEPVPNAAAAKIGGCRLVQPEAYNIV